MFFFLVVAAISRTLALDFGGKYLKGAIVENDGTVMYLKNLEVPSLAIPGAITSQLSGPLSMENIKHAIKIDGVSIGYAALKLIEKNRTRGVPFLGATFGKDISYLKANHDLLGIDKNATFGGLPPSWYFLRLLAAFESWHGRFEEILLVLPFSTPVYTRGHLRILGAFLGKRLQIITDTEAYGLAIAKILQPKLGVGQSAVSMIVDVGAFALKVQLIKTSRTDPKSRLQTTFQRGMFSEDAGLEAIAHRISVAEGIKRKKAVKSLEKASDPDPVFRSEFLRIAEALKLEDVPKIEFVQVVGGGARYKWVEKVIREGIGGGIPVLFNINQITGLMDAAVEVVGQEISSETMLAYPLYVTHGNARIELFTDDTALFQNIAFPYTGDLFVNLTTDSKCIPRGFDTTMYVFRLDVNQTKIEKEANLIFSATCKFGTPMLHAASLCSNRVCYPVEVLDMHKGEVAAVLEMSKAVDPESARQLLRVFRSKFPDTVDVEDLLQRNSSWVNGSPPEFLREL